MAGFDPELQRSGRWPGGVRADTGVFDISSGSNTIDVPTSLARVISGMAMADFTATTGDSQQTLFAFKVGDASNGKVTFMRGAGNLNEDARLSYTLTGY